MLCVVAQVPKEPVREVAIVLGGASHLELHDVLRIWAVALLQESCGMVQAGSHHGENVEHPSVDLQQVLECLLPCHDSTVTELMQPLLGRRFEFPIVLL